MVWPCARKSEMRPVYFRAIWLNSAFVWGRSRKALKIASACREKRTRSVVVTTLSPLVVLLFHGVVVGGFHHRANIVTGTDQALFCPAPRKVRVSVVLVPHR